MWDDVKSSCTADSLFNATPPAIVRLCHQTILGITKHGGFPSQGQTQLNLGHANGSKLTDRRKTEKTGRRGTGRHHDYYCYWPQTRPQRRKQPMQPPATTIGNSDVGCDNAVAKPLRLYPNAPERAYVSPERSPNAVRSRTRVRERAFPERAFPEHTNAPERAFGPN